MSGTIWLRIGALVAAAACSSADERATVAIEFVVTPPAATPADTPLWIAGNVAELGGWRPDGVALIRADDGTRCATVAIEQGAALEWKVTGGSWATVEKDARGGEIANRRHVALADARLEAVVARFASGAADKPAKPTVPAVPTIVGRLDHHAGFGKQSGLLERSIHVWLPPGSEAAPATPDAAPRRFPVLYLHDGQNLFDATTAFAGVEWQVDETCDRLIRAGEIEPLIVVGIDNTADRMAEYTPIADAEWKAGGRAADHARLLFDEVKPFVDAHYPTLADRAHTFVAGSSLGGLDSLWLAQTHGDAIGGVAALSPSLQWQEEWLTKELAKRPIAVGTRVWLDMGDAELADAGRSREMVARVERCAAALEQGGLERDRDFTVRVFEAAHHDEAAWAARFDQVVRFLLPKPAKTPIPTKEP